MLRSNYDTTFIFFRIERWLVKYTGYIILCRFWWLLLIKRHHKIIMQWKWWDVWFKMFTKQHIVQGKTYTWEKECICRLPFSFTGRTVPTISTMGSSRPMLSTRNVPATELLVYITVLTGAALAPLTQATYKWAWKTFDLFRADILGHVIQLPLSVTTISLFIAYMLKKSFYKFVFTISSIK
jgi:hypothetical protein